MDYKNYRCPVCENEFSEEDDVVVCPDCGTPHHRECYFKNGKCFNEDLHGKTEENLSEGLKIKQPEETEDNEKNAENSEKISDKEDIEKAREEIINIIEQVESKSEENTICGESFATYAAAIGKNESYYLLRFKMIEARKAKGVWNGAAFFAPFSWSICRKMYKLAAIIFALYIVFFGALSYSIFSNGELVEASVKCAEEDPYFYTAILEYSENGGTLTPTQSEFYELIQKNEIPFWVQAVYYVITFGTRMFMGIKATPLYMKKLTAAIKKEKAKGLSEEQLRLRLARKYGTFPAVLVGIAILFEAWMFLM